jgi:hypothetical protein
MPKTSAMRWHQAVHGPGLQGELDKKCLRNVQSREHWWQHLSYALTHLSPEK